MVLVIYVVCLWRGFFSFSSGYDLYFASFLGGLWWLLMGTIDDLYGLFFYIIIKIYDIYRRFIWLLF